LEIDTLAPETAAPDLSSTTPRTEVVPVCAIKLTAMSKYTTADKKIFIAGVLCEVGVPSILSQFASN
jgi:hypothetical protein